MASHADDPMSKHSGFAPFSALLPHRSGESQHATKRPYFVEPTQISRAATLLTPLNSIGAGNTSDATTEDDDNGRCEPDTWYDVRNDL